MGGSGSSRWGWYRKKKTVESSRQLPIRRFLDLIRELERSDVFLSAHAFPRWTRDGPPNDYGTIAVLLNGFSNSIEARLKYQTTNVETGEMTDYDYQVGLEYTQVAWGSLRWWWTCPKCSRRSGTLYMARGSEYFSCRQCQDLSYVHRQEAYPSKFLAGLISHDMLESFPYLSIHEIVTMVSCDLEGIRLPKRISEKIDNEVQRRIDQELAKFADPYKDYLTPAAICDHSGLTASQLGDLKAARLLVPDHEDRYRPKLAGWAKKLGGLLQKGWSVQEIKAWTKTRWNKPDISNPS